MNDELQEITNKIDELPPISPNTSSILNLVAQSDYTVKELQKLIELDISLTTNCLRLVNSAAFGLRSPINSIERAISFLGSKNILNLLINNSFGGVYSSPLDGYFCNQNALWEHSLRTAIAARLLAGALSQSESADIAYTAGLLHDIGKVVIEGFLTKYSDKYEKLLVENDGVDFASIEFTLLKINHMEVGLQMATKWKLPEVLKAAIRFHHSPGEAPIEHRSICLLVHLGDILAMIGGFGTGVDSLVYSVDPLVEEKFKLDMHAQERLLLDIDEEFNKANDMILETAGEKL